MHDLNDWNCNSTISCSSTGACTENESLTPPPPTINGEPNLQRSQ